MQSLKKIHAWAQMKVFLSNQHKFCLIVQKNIIRIKIDEIMALFRFISG